MTESSLPITISRTKGGWLARTIAALVFAVFLLPLGIFGTIGTVLGGTPLGISTIVPILFLTWGVVCARGTIRGVNHYRNPSLMTIGSDGLEVRDPFETR